MDADSIPLRRSDPSAQVGADPAALIDNIKPIGALTFGRVNTVASVGGAPAAPDRMNNWRYVELLVDSGAVDNVGDPRAFPEYKLRESDGSRNGLHYLAANNGKIKNDGGAQLVLP